MTRPIVLCTLGTRGDVAPFVLLASELHERGHRVISLSNDRWGPEFTGAGAEFWPIAPADEPQTGRDDEAFFRANTLPSFRRSFDLVTGLVENGQCPLLVYRVNMLGMQCAAERYGLPNIRVALQPSVIRSYRAPPWPLSSLTDRPGGWLAKRTIVPLAYALGSLRTSYRRHANAFRKSVGLAPRKWFALPEKVEDLVVMLCPRWFAWPQPDWPDNVCLVGFPLPLPTLPAGGDQYCLRGHVVATPGTGIDDPDRFFDVVARFCEQAGLPALFLSPDIPTRFRRRPTIWCHDFIPLDAALTHASMLIHHGGIGTTAEGIRAGIPQIVIPDRFDQPDNAMRTAKLGLGGVILDDDYTVDHLMSVSDRLQKSMHVRVQLQTAKALVESDKAISDTADIIEELISRKHGSPQSAPEPVPSTATVPTHESA